MLTNLLWIFLLTLWIYVLWNRRKYYKLILKLPGSIGYPIIGILHRFFTNEGRSFVNVFGKEIQKWGPVWLCWFGPMPLLVVSDPQISQEILNSPHAMDKARWGYNGLRRIIENGLAVKKDPLWSKHRKALNPAFGHNILISFLPIFNKEAGALVVELDKLVGMGENNLLPHLKNQNLRIATQTTMGNDIKNEQIYRNNTLMNSYNRILEIGSQITHSPWLDNKLMRYLFGIENIFNECHSTIRQLIKKFIDRTLETDLQPKNRSNTFIDVAIDHLKTGVLSHKDVESECHTIVVGAFETTAFTLINILMLMAMYPEYQEKAYEEIKSVFPNREDVEVNYEDIQKMEYLNMVINESLRLFPIFSLIGRQLNQNIRISNGVELPSGLQVFICIYHMHRRKDVWGPEAEVFNPVNCTPQNLEGKHPYAFIPFSKGKRNCIGWKYALISMKVTLAKVLRNYKLSTSTRFEDLIIVDYMALKFQDVPMKLERRPC
ncbi:probable cytochrome P450 313a4 [Drosophila grimshawi]|uniref:GH17317 n=1 Tax=Drosophila grimshawi TaxID=7222 RepID=B4JUN1_DROGR|nr:probable cytochrome P450 313a4 [Drosophila grimshawi]EDV91201.1 GH17317 [Drosophila grimshawi]